MKIVMAIMLMGFAASPALANECPTLQAQIDQTFGKRVDRTAAAAKALARDAWNLHKAGKHEESVAKYGEAAKAGNIELRHAR